MAVNFETHKAVVIITEGELHFGFTSVAKAVEFIEEQLPKDNKLIDNIANALADGVDINGSEYQILDIDAYADVYSVDGDDDDEA
jgi:hypothetical protein